MYIKFGWGKNLDNNSLKYVATEANVELSSSKEYGHDLGNCLPSVINVTLEVEARYKEYPAADIFDFANKQGAVARTEGAGKIVMYPKIDVEQIIQVIDFDNAWISRILARAKADDMTFSIELTIMAANVTVSDVKFEDKRLAQIVTASKS